MLEAHQQRAEIVRRCLGELIDALTDAERERCIEGIMAGTRLSFEERAELRQTLYEASVRLGAMIIDRAVQITAAVYEGTPEAACPHLSRVA